MHIVAHIIFFYHYVEKQFCCIWVPWSFIFRAFVSFVSTLEDIAWKFSRFVWMEGGALLQFNVNEGLSHPAQPTNVLVGKMSSDKIPDKSCDSHCVPESKPHRGHRDFLGTLL